MGSFTATRLKSLESRFAREHQRLCRSEHKAYFVGITIVSELVPRHSTIPLNSFFLY